MDSKKSIESCFKKGIYATLMNKKWTSPTDSVFADYLGMRPCDNVYFFSDRKIYGIGEIIEANPTHMCNPHASEPLYNYKKRGKIQRWGCAFKPAPYFFQNGVDMDDTLQSAPNAFKTLRAFERVSFIKIDDFENQALKDYILYYNREVLGKTPSNKEIYKCDSAKLAKCAEDLKRKNGSLNPSPFFDWAQNKNKTKYRRESALECNLMWDFASRACDSAKIFGDWDFVSHQVVASPFKPIFYMDRMDIFGYEYIPNHSPTILKYKVCELKKDEAGEKEINQCMKYVDWIRDTYANGDYSKIKAYLVASSFNLCEGWRDCIQRNYVSGSHDLIALCWNDLTLVQYRYDSTQKRAIYEIYNA